MFSFTLATISSLGEGSSDSDVIEYAKRQNAVILTLDRDFNDYLAREKAASPSVIFIRAFEEITMSEIISGIIQVLNARLENPRCFIAILQKGRNRVRDLPISPALF